MQEFVTKHLVAPTSASACKRALVESVQLRTCFMFDVYDYVIVVFSASIPKK